MNTKPTELLYKKVYWSGTAWAVVTGSGLIISAPDRVTRSQGKLALIRFGHWASVMNYVDSITDDEQRAIAETALNDTQHWRRDSAFLMQCADAIGLSQSEVTDLFIFASQIEV